MTVVFDDIIFCLYMYMFEDFSSKYPEKEGGLGWGGVLVDGHKMASSHSVRKNWPRTEARRVNV